MGAWVQKSTSTSFQRYQNVWALITNITIRLSSHLYNQQPSMCLILHWLQQFYQWHSCWYVTVDTVLIFCSLSHSCLCCSGTTTKLELSDRRSLWASFMIVSFSLVLTKCHLCSLYSKLIHCITNECALVDLFCIINEPVVVDLFSILVTLYKSFIWVRSGCWDPQQLMWLSLQSYTTAGKNGHHLIPAYQHIS